VILEAEFDVPASNGSGQVGDVFLDAAAGGRYNWMIRQVPGLLVGQLQELGALFPITMTRTGAPARRPEACVPGSHIAPYVCSSTSRQSRSRVAGRCTDEEAGMSGRKLLLDAPTENPALGYRQIASAFAEVITQSKPNFAIGIFGGWGSGKTTLMAAIKAALPEDDFAAVNFNAWRFEREPQLLIPLLDTIRAELARHAKRNGETSSKLHQITERLGKVVRALAKGLSGSVGLPGAVVVNYDAGQALEALSALSADQDSLKPESLYVAAFQELQDSFTHLAEAGINGIVVFQASAAMTSLTEQLGREYAKKIFQVPYSLPVMLPQQLTDLLESMYEEAGIEDEQLADLHERVRPYVNFIAVERRVNPREVKRFINSYTLQTLIRPELNPDVILALQTLAFRRDWEEAYDAINADSELFLGALRSYRTGYRAAFEDTLPGLRKFPPDLNNFLASPLAEPLVAQPSLDAYLSSLRSTRGSGTWMFDLFHALGRLERAVANVLASKPENPIEIVIKALDRYRDTAEVKAPTPAVREKVSEISRRLARSRSELSSALTAEPYIAPNFQDLAAEIEQFKAELRFIRDAETI
jgi:hypothetical protein